MSSLKIHNVIRIKIKKLNFIIKTLDNYRPNNTSNSGDDTDRDDNDFASYLYDTKEKTQKTIIEIEDDLSCINNFSAYSNKISKKLNSTILNNPEFHSYNNYLIHLRFILNDNKKYLILLINDKNNFELREISSFIIQNFSQSTKYLFNPILFDIDLDIYSKNKFIKNLLKFGRTTNKIPYNHNYTENHYSYNDGVFNYFIQINKSNKTFTYYYYRIDRYIFSPIS